MQIYDKKGMSSSKVGGLVGVLLLVVIIAALAPTMFTNWSVSSAPSWYNTVGPIIIAAGLVLTLWKAFR